MAVYDTIWVNAHLATMRAGLQEPFGALRDGVVAALDGRIAFVGRRTDLPDEPMRLADTVVDAGWRWITPGLVDPHTHLIFGGDRLADFERRLAGESYDSAAHGGGGIAHTVAATRAASDEELFGAARERLATMIAHGATTVEIKSGYGLDIETELRLLRIARRLGSACGITVRTTYLGAHVVPAEYAERRDAYIELVADTVLPRAHAEGLVDAVDVFCDRIAFSPAETQRVLDAAQRLGIPVKVHADQIEGTGAAGVAARMHALSADHIERASAEDIDALAGAGTVAVLLPGAFHYLRETVKPPVGALRRAGVPIALATDCNPGTSPVTSLQTVMNLACVLFGLSPEEAVAGVTREAARALGLADRGTLTIGARCDLALWDAAAPAELCYWLGSNLCTGVVVGGTPLPR